MERGAMRVGLGMLVLLTGCASAPLEKQASSTPTKLRSGLSFAYLCSGGEVAGGMLLVEESGAYRLGWRDEEKAYAAGLIATSDAKASGDDLELTVRHEGQAVRLSCGAFRAER
jgi:hypothetical protein